MDILKPYRAKIDDLDDRIIDLLAQRLDVIHEVAALKAEKGLPAILQDRVDEVRNRCIARGEEKGLDPELIRQLYTLLIEHCCTLENDFISKNDRKSA